MKPFGQMSNNGKKAVLQRLGGGLHGLPLRVLLTLIDAGKPLTLLEMQALFPQCGVLKIRDALEIARAFGVVGKVIMAKGRHGWNAYIPRVRFEERRKLRRKSPLAAGILYE